MNDQLSTDDVRPIPDVDDSLSRMIAEMNVIDELSKNGIFGLWHSAKDLAWYAAQVRLAFGYQMRLKAHHDLKGQELVRVLARINAFEMLEDWEKP